MEEAGRMPAVPVLSRRAREYEDSLRSDKELTIACLLLRTSFDFVVT
jgi:hypothetical protein